MTMIYYDSVAGDLKSGHVWQIDVEEEGSLSGLVYAESTGDDICREVQCPVDRRHIIQVECTKIVLDLFGGPELGNFIPVINQGYNVVSSKFVKMLQSSGLSGFKLRPVVSVRTNQSRRRDVNLFLFEIVGKGGISHRFKVRGGPNLCPHCETEPVLCPGCGQILGRCSLTGEPTLSEVRIDAEPRDRVMFAGEPDELIVEADEWDGSDFFAVGGDGGGWFANQHGKQWLQRNGIEEFVLKPALLNVQ